MRAYIIRRLLLVIPTLFILSVLVFLSVRFIPGDVIDVMAARIEAMGSGQVDRAAMERRLGLDLPIQVQYGHWIGGILLRGTLGESLLGGWRIEERMLGRLPVTAELGAAGHPHRPGHRTAGGHLLGGAPVHRRRLSWDGRSPSWDWPRPTSGWERW